jgi:hypothetical protein
MSRETKAVADEMVTVLYATDFTAVERRSCRSFAGAPFVGAAKRPRRPRTNGQGARPDRPARTPSCPIIREIQCEMTALTVIHCEMETQMPIQCEIPIYCETAPF